MDVNVPNELFEIIFKLVSVRDLIACRKVCLQWKEIVDSFETLWRNACEKDYSEVYQQAYDKSSLSWAELYTALSLWPEIKHAQIKTQKLARSPFNQFQVLQKGIIGVPEHDQHVDGETACNTIVYYDLDTSEEDCREIFDFNFVAYAENEKFIVVVDSDDRVCVVHKVDRERFFFYDVIDSKSPDDMCFREHAILKLFDNIVYFKNTNLKMNVFKLEVVDSDITTKIVKFGLYNTLDVVSICNVDDNNINILDDNCDIYSYCFTSNTGVYIVFSSGSRHGVRYLPTYMHIQDELESYGFNWHSKPVLQCILENGDHENPHVLNDFIDLEATAICAHGDIIVLGSYVCMLYIYYKPYNDEGSLRMNNERAIRSIDLTDAFNIETETKIEQLDIVEMVDGHRVIVMMKDQVYTLELMHTSLDNRAVLGDREHEM